MKAIRRFVVIALLCAGCAGPSDPPPSSIPPIDSAKVQAATANLKTDPELAGCVIRVRAENALLILDGKVNSEQAKQRAETLVKKVQGIKNVANHLQVEAGAKPPGETAAP